MRSPQGLLNFDNINIACILNNFKGMVFFMCIKTKILKAVMKSKDREECMIEILDILDKYKRKETVKNVITAIGVSYLGYYLYNVWASQFVMEVPQEVEEKVMGFKPPMKKETEEIVKE